MKVDVSPAGTEHRSLLPNVTPATRRDLIPHSSAREGILTGIPRPHFWDGLGQNGTNSSTIEAGETPAVRHPEPPRTTPAWSPPWSRSWRRPCRAAFAFSARRTAGRARPYHLGMAPNPESRLNRRSVGPGGGRAAGRLLTRAGGQPMSSGRPVASREPTPADVRPRSTLCYPLISWDSSDIQCIPWDLSDTIRVPASRD